MATTDRLTRLREARIYAAEILDDPEVRARMLKDAQLGLLPPGTMTRLMDYRFGKPADQIVLTNDMGGEDALTDLSDEELLGMIRELQEALVTKSETGGVAGVSVN